MKREKKGGIALGACWSFSQNLLKHFEMSGFCLLCFHLPLDGAVAGQEMT